MTKHIQTITSMSLVAGLLAGCAEGDLIDGGTSQGLGAEDGALSEDETGEGTGDGGDGEYLPPDHDDDPDLDPDPVGRIIWVGDEDGDLIVHARLGLEVAADYPEGVMYRIRFDADGQAMYAEIVDADDVMLEVVRVAERTPVIYPAEEETVLSFCFPFPLAAPKPDNCTFPPCPWSDPWPLPGDPGPDCIEISKSGDMVRVVGAIEGTPMGQVLTQDGDPVPMFDTPFTFAQTQRVQTVSKIAEDISTLAPELEPLDEEKTHCGILGAYASARGSACGILDLDACSDAFWASMAYDIACS